MFGVRSQKATIDGRTDVRGILQRILGETKEKFLWTHNLSSKRFKDHFGKAVESDPFLQQGLCEWHQNVANNKDGDQAFCCLEDVSDSEEAKKNYSHLCFYNKTKCCRDT